MQNIKIVESIRVFLEKEAQFGRRVNLYKINSNLPEYFKNLKIKVELDNCKEIILKEESKLELGGVNKKSFSLIFPINEQECVNDGIITLIGPEIHCISEPSIDFGIFILIGLKRINDNDFDVLRHFNFISNGIEGFMIRTIPRRFWCRISENVINEFSFEFFGNAIMYLYKKKFKDLIKSMEIIFINSHPDLIDEFIEVTSDIREDVESKWKEKVEKWKKRVDCDYDWDCEECIYYEVCEDVKDVLEERNKIEN